jgi:hypothetical protein
MPRKEVWVVVGGTIGNNKGRRTVVSRMSMRPATTETTGILLKIDHWRIKIPSWDEQDKKAEPAKPSQSNDSWDGWDDAKDDGFDSYNSHSPTNKGTNQNGISGGSYWDGGFR